jgi:hypothetical protein
MSERDALLAAVVEAPEEDAPRLVFADWLDPIMAFLRWTVRRLER